MLEIDHIEIEDAELMNQLFEKGFIQRGELLTLADDTANFFLLTCGNQSAIVAAKGVFLNLVRDGQKCGVITPRDKEQLCATHAFKNYELAVVLGNAGSGKTTLALAWGYQRIFKANKKLILCKPTTQVGGSSRAIGTVPGTVEEKLSPYIASYLGTMKDIAGKANFDDKIEELKSKDLLEFLPIELVRGLNLLNCTLIVDEVQNLTVHELNSVISRAGEGTQVLLLGDLSQIDTKMRREDTGVYKLINSETFLDSDIAIGVQLVQTYRSGVAKLSIDWMEELSGS